MPGVLLLLGSPAWAGGVVNNCTEADLRAALAGGGTVTFACDGTIRLTNTLTIASDSVLDARGRTVVLSGGNAVRLFFVNTNVTLMLRELTLTEGRHNGDSTGASDASGGALYSAGGTVNLVDCVLTNNAAWGGPGSTTAADGGRGLGGAIYNAGGSVNALATLFTSNTATGGVGSIQPGFPVDRPGNGGDAHGGAIFNDGGRVSLTNSVLSGNWAVGGVGFNSSIGTSGRGGAAFGGGIHNLGGDLTMIGVVFAGNQGRGNRTAPGISFSMGAGGYGGGLYHSGGTVTGTDCLFTNNSAIAHGNDYGSDQPGCGGAIYLDAGSMTFEASDFLGNRATGGDGGRHGVPEEGAGGAIYANGTLRLQDVFFSGNESTGGNAGDSGGDGNGGAIKNVNALAIVGCTFAENAAYGGTGGYFVGTGGKGAGGALYNSGSVAVTNSTFYANTVRGGEGQYPTFSGTPSIGGDGLGGGVYSEGGTVSAQFSTFAMNGAVGGPGGTESGLGLGGGLGNTNGVLTLGNCIVAASTDDSGNIHGPVNDAGHNLSSDATGNFSAPGSLNNTDPKLGPFGDHGGPTPTIPLFEDSPAIDGGDLTVCPPTDQRGYPRPVGAGCDIGAFEGSLPRPPVLTMAFSPTTVITGAVTVLSYVLENPNASTLNGVSFTNWLPAALRVAADPGVVNGCGTGTVTAQAGGQYVLATGGSLTNQQRCSITVNIVGLTPGAVINTAGPISSAEGGAAPAPATAVVTLIAPPSVVTGVARDVQEHSLVFSGTANPNGSATMAWFEYGPTSSYGSQSSVRELGSGYSTLVVSNLVADLPSYGFYHYRLVAQNDAGTAYGADATVRLLGLARTNLALRLDGTNDFVSIGWGGGLNGVSEGTIELWAQWNGVQPDEPSYGLHGAVFSRQGSFGLQDILALDNRHPAFAHVIWSPYSPSGAILGTTLVGDGVWRHIAVTFRPGGHRLYVDGVLQGTSAALGVLGNDPAATLRLGSLATTPDRFASCVVDEVRIWLGVRTPEDIQYYRTHPLDSSTQGLIAYWRLDEGSGLVAHDATGHGFDGTRVNGPIWATALNPVDYGMTLAGAPTDAAFRLDLIGQPGRPFVLEGSGDLLEWVGAVTNQFGVDCRFQYDAPPSSATPLEFYRIVAP